MTPIEILVLFTSDVVAFTLIWFLRAAHSNEAGQLQVFEQDGKKPSTINEHHELFWDVAAFFR